MDKPCSFCLFWKGQVVLCKRLLDFSDQKQLKEGWHQFCWTVASPLFLKRGWEGEHEHTYQKVLKIAAQQDKADCSSEAPYRHPCDRISPSIKAAQTASFALWNKQVLRGGSQHTPRAGPAHRHALPTRCRPLSGRCYTSHCGTVSQLAL